MANPNPRTSNGARRRAIRARIQSQGMPCHICGKPIDYSLTTYIDPKDGKRKRHPMSFEVDEIVPVSKGGDPLDIRNCAPAHRICNQMRGNTDIAMCQHKPVKGHQPVGTSRQW